MTTNVELASQLLRNAANFFRDLGGQNAELTAQMSENAKLYDTVAKFLETDPDGEISEPSGGEG
ncbi:MAG TPA: hypothetical protein ENI79_03920 [Rhodospirillales bacterium]|nr:hypothetical protein [Rhodospirillales bacterium]